MLAYVIDGVVHVVHARFCRRPCPDLECVGIALTKARVYKPTFMDMKQAKQAVAAKAHARPCYFGLLPEIVLQVVDALDTHHQERGMPLCNFLRCFKS